MYSYGVKERRQSGGWGAWAQKNIWDALITYFLKRPLKDSFEMASRNYRPISSDKWLRRRMYLSYRAAEVHLAVCRDRGTADFTIGKKKGVGPFPWFFSLWDKMYNKPILMHQLKSVRTL